MKSNAEQLDLAGGMRQYPREADYPSGSHVNSNHQSSPSNLHRQQKMAQRKNLSELLGGPGNPKSKPGPSSHQLNMVANPSTQKSPNNKPAARYNSNNPIDREHD